MSKNNDWERVRDFSPVLLYTFKEVEKYFGVRDFFARSQELTEEGVFSEEHFIMHPCKRGIKSFWTRKGIDHLKTLYFLTSTEIDELTSLYHFVADSIGVSPLCGEVTERRNMLHPDAPIKKGGVTSFFQTLWAEIEKKERRKMLGYLDILKEIKEEIVQGELERCTTLKTLDYNEYVY